MCGRSKLGRIYSSSDGSGSFRYGSYFPATTECRINERPADVEETVVTKVLAALTSLCTLGLFQKMRVWELMSATLGFLYHPNVWIRQGSPFRSLMYRYILTLFSSRGCCFHCFGGKGASVKRCLVYCVPFPSALSQVRYCHNRRAEPLSHHETSGQ